MPKDTCKHRDRVLLDGISFWSENPVCVCLLFDDDRWTKFKGGIGPSGAELYVWNCAYYNARTDCRSLPPVTLEQATEILGCHPLELLRPKYAQGHL